MKNIFSAITRSPKLAGLTAVVAGVILVPAALLAWGPDRPTFTMAQPADHVVFNSITDNPKAGDERNFVGMREAGVGNFTDDVALQAGKEYEVSVFYHNNASTTFNDAAHNYSGIAHDAKMLVEMPADVKAGQKARITGTVSASNAQPQSVWDEAYGSANADLALRYVQGSAKVTSLGAINGQTMPDSLFTTGAPLGFNAFDGVVPGCNNFEGWVIFRFKAVAPDFTVEKTVSKVGANSFSKSVNVNAGDTVDYKIQYKNTGSVNQENVVVKDQLPAGMSMVSNSTNIFTSATNGQWVKTNDDNVVTKTGINIGTYLPNGNAYVTFKAKVASADQLKCGVNSLVNTATVDTANGSKSDTATVTVNKVCAVTELPQTGTTSNILTFLGLGAVTAGLAYAVNSQRLRALLRR